MELFWAMFLFFLFITIVFVAITFFFPEVMGITGKKALEIQKEQHTAETQTEVVKKD